MIILDIITIIAMLISLFACLMGIISMGAWYDDNSTLKEEMGCSSKNILLIIPYLNILFIITEIIKNKSNKN